jgi:hypothetical protein
MMPGGPRPRHRKFNPASGPRLADNAANTAGFRGARHHVGQAIPVLARQRRIEPMAVILDGHQHLLFTPPNLQKHFAGAGMPHRIVKRLLDAEK